MSRILIPPFCKGGLGGIWHLHEINIGLRVGTAHLHLFGVTGFQPVLEQAKAYGYIIELVPKLCLGNPQDLLIFQEPHR